MPERNDEKHSYKWSPALSFGKLAGGAVMLTCHVRALSHMALGLAFRGLHRKVDRAQLGPMQAPEGGPREQGH